MLLILNYSSLLYKNPSVQNCYPICWDRQSPGNYPKVDTEVVTLLLVKYDVEHDVKFLSISKNV